MHCIAIILLSYLLGCFPSSFIVVKCFSGKDIRKEGTGKTGTANTLDVLGRKFPALLVLLADLTKGVLAVLLAEKFAGAELVPWAAIAACLGHNKNVFLRFSGGRGLACAAGSLLSVNYLFVLLWLMAWGVGHLCRLNMDRKNIIASALSIVLALPFPVAFVDVFATFIEIPVLSLQLMVIALNLLALSSYLPSQKKKSLS